MTLLLLLSASIYDIVLKRRASGGCCRSAATENELVEVKYPEENSGFEMTNSTENLEESKVDPGAKAARDANQDSVPTVTLTVDETATNESNDGMEAGARRECESSSRQEDGHPDNQQGPSKDKLKSMSFNFLTVDWLQHMFFVTCYFDCFKITHH